mmetsp:Transcript_50363/g.126424  ORF Transcript_50363/g.126424 Transcript_50363/m.126424 type:complete len:207 (-) Transcript_50363:108-728(-)
MLDRTSNSSASSSAGLGQAGATSASSRCHGRRAPVLACHAMHSYMWQRMASTAARGVGGHGQGQPTSSMNADAPPCTPHALGRAGHASACTRDVNARMRGLGPRAGGASTARHTSATVSSALAAAGVASRKRSYTHTRTKSMSPMMRHTVVSTYAAAHGRAQSGESSRRATACRNAQRRAGSGTTSHAARKARNAGCAGSGACCSR